MKLSSMFSFVISSISGLFALSGEKKLKKIQQKEEWEKERIVLQQRYRKQKRVITLKYGNPTYTLSLKEYNLNEEIMVFSRSRRVMLQGKIYFYSELSSCTYTDNQRILKGEAAFVSKSNTAETDSLRGFEYDTYHTSCFESSVISDKEIITHNYNLIIKVKDPQVSIIKIPMGSNFEKVNELLGVMNSVINYNNQPGLVSIKQAVSWS